MTTTVHDPTPPQNVDGFVGKHLIYTYANGWRYELYMKNAKTIDYRIHDGLVGGRWVKDQEVDLVRLDEDSYKVSWTEPTGTSVSLSVDQHRRRLHGVIFFPRWVEEHPQRTVCFQNDHLDEIRRYRDQGPTYPIYTVSEFATITFVEQCDPDDETVIDRSPGELPENHPARAN